MGDFINGKDINVEFSNRKPCILLYFRNLHNFLNTENDISTHDFARWPARSRRNPFRLLQQLYSQMSQYSSVLVLFNKYPILGTRKLEFVSAGKFPRRFWIQCLAGTS